MTTASEAKVAEVERLPGIARGGAFLIEPLGSRDIFITGEFTDEQLAYAETAEDFVEAIRSPTQTRRWAAAAERRVRRW